MICKGWYTNHEKISKRQAVENYIKEYLECEPYNDCIVTILYNAVKLAPNIAGRLLNILKNFFNFLFNHK